MREKIIKEVCDYFEISEEQLKSKSRDQGFLFPRFIAMNIIKEVENLNPKILMEEFNRHRTTYYNFERDFEDMLISYPEVNNAYKYLRGRFIEGKDLNESHNKTYFERKGKPGYRWKIKGVDKEKRTYQKKDSARVNFEMLKNFEVLGELKNQL